MKSDIEGESNYKVSQCWVEGIRLNEIHDFVEQDAFAIKHRITSAQISYFQVLQQILQTAWKFEDNWYTTT